MLRLDVRGLGSQDRSNHPHQTRHELMPYDAGGALASTCLNGTEGSIGSTVALGKRGDKKKLSISCMQDSARLLPVTNTQKANSESPWPIPKSQHQPMCWDRGCHIPSPKSCISHPRTIQRANAWTQTQIKLTQPMIEHRLPDTFMHRKPNRVDDTDASFRFDSTPQRYSPYFLPGL
jgi:hypothetical protein